MAPGSSDVVAEFPADFAITTTVLFILQEATCVIVHCKWITIAKYPEDIEFAFV